MVTEKENFKELEISFDEILIEIIYIAVFFKTPLGKDFPFACGNARKSI